MLSAEVSVGRQSSYLHKIYSSTSIMRVLNRRMVCQESILVFHHEIHCMVTRVKTVSFNSVCAILVRLKGRPLSRLHSIIMNIIGEISVVWCFCHA